MMSWAHVTNSVMITTFCSELAAAAQIDFQCKPECTSLVAILRINHMQLTQESAAAPAQLLVLKCCTSSSEGCLLAVMEWGQRQS